MIIESMRVGNIGRKEKRKVIRIAYETFWLSPHLDENWQQAEFPLIEESLSTL